jgi:upstream activation factor subunit UAF30
MFLPIMLLLYAAEKVGGFSKPCQLSSQLSEFIGCDVLPRTEVVKRMWAYIKANDLQNPKDRREIICDATLEKVLKRKKVTMFQLNKVLAPVSRHAYHQH